MTADSMTKPSSKLGYDVMPKFPKFLKLDSMPKTGIVGGLTTSFKKVASTVSNAGNSALQYMPGIERPANIENNSTPSSNPSSAPAEEENYMTITNIAILGALSAIGYYGYKRYAK